ncbi:MAG: TonB-dependent receptor, partial [Rikenellaceae bacterium]
MKFIFSILTLLCVTFTTFTASAAPESVVKGHVVDAATKEHIPYATIATLGTTYGCASDENGHFTLKGLPEGTHSLRCSMMGYTPSEISVTIKGGKGTQEVTFAINKDIMMMDQVVVTSSRSQVTRRESPTVVSVLTADLFDKVGAPALSDGLNYQPGVRVEDNCQNCGFTQVRINGLDGHYSQILIDSRPMFSALTGVYGLEQIPSNMIDRVEVIRGGGSALYGSSAIGGTVNIITKAPSRNSAEFEHSIMSIDGTGATDNNTRANLSYISDNQRAGFTLFAQSRERDHYDANGDGFSEIAELSSKTIGARTTLKTSLHSKLDISFDAREEYRRGGDLFDLPAHEANIAEQVDHKIYGGGVSYDLFSADYNRKFNIYTSIQDTHRDSYYGAYQDPNAYGTTKEIISVTGTQFSTNWDKVLMPAEFIAGLEFYYSDLEDEYLGYEILNAQTVENYSAFVQNEWRNDKFGFLLGVRADKNSLLDDPIFSPRVNFRYNPTKEINLRATYSTGFRAPQIFDEDLHIGIVNGEALRPTLSDDLKEEISRSVSISADMYKNFGKVSTNLLIEGFYTTLDDAFASEIVEIDGIEYDCRYNSAGATVKGINTELRISLPSKLDFQIGATLQSSKYNEAEEWSEDEDVAAERKMFRTPDFYGYFMTTYSPTTKLSMSLNATYTGSMLVQHFAGAENGPE